MGLRAAARTRGGAAGALPVKLGADLPGREPDVLFVAAAYLERLHDTWLGGPPDLAVEVSSPESAARDPGAKYLEYEAAGVPEHRLIDPLRQQVEFHVRGADGRFRTVLAGHQGRFHSTAMPGFWLDAGWLWSGPLPDEAEVSAWIAGPEV